MIPTKSDYAIVADPGGADNLDVFAAITLAACVNPDGLQFVNGCCGGIVTKYESSPRVSWGLDIQNDELRFVYLGNEFSSSGVDLTSGEWVHVAGTWDGSDVRLFTDGVQVAFGANVFTTIADTTVNVNIGAFQAFASGARSAFFDGIDRRGVPVRPCPHRS